MTAAQIEALILDHMPMVERVAKRAAKRMPPWIELDELTSAGYEGLVQAANRYNPELHPNFEYYAYFRVWGAMIEPYRGRNYPRLMKQMPEPWMQGGYGDEDEYDPDAEIGPSHLCPAALIDPHPSAEDAMIRQQEERRAVVCITRARRQLTPEEGRALDRNLNGQSMREVGEQEGRSGAWAHYTIHRGKRKLREQFEVLDGGKKAA